MNRLPQVLASISQSLLPASAAALSLTRVSLPKTTRKLYDKTSDIHFLNTQIDIKSPSFLDMEEGRMLANSGMNGEELFHQLRNIISLEH